MATADKNDKKTWQKGEKMLWLYQEVLLQYEASHFERILCSNGQTVCSQEAAQEKRKVNLRLGVFFNDGPEIRIIKENHKFLYCQRKKAAWGPPW